MHPILFYIGDAPVQSYYLLWTGALSMAVIFSRRRMTLYYGIADDDSRRIITWAFLGMLLGARVGSVYDSWDYFMADPVRLLRIWEGGLSAVPAFLGAGLFSLVTARVLHVPYWKVADAASLPAALTVAVGRWGCLLNGCCYGIQTSVPWAVRLASDPFSITRHPTQLYYSFGALMIAALLQWVEARRIGVGSARRIQGAVLCPLFAVLYSILRLVADPFRDDYYRAGMQANRLILPVALLCGLLWLAWSYYRSTDRARDS